MHMKVRQGPCSVNVPFFPTVSHVPAPVCTLLRLPGGLAEWRPLLLVQTLFPRALLSLRENSSSFSS